MTQPWWPRDKRVLVVAIFAAACTALLTLATAPKTVTVAELGSDWQCRRAAFVLTTCTRADHAAPMIHIQRKDGAVARRPA